jgi:hypothetical protein
MTGDLPQAPLGALTVSVSTQSSETHGIGVLCDESHLARGETVSPSDTKSQSDGVQRVSPATHFCHESLDPLHNSIDGAKSEFEIPYSSFDSGYLRTCVLVGMLQVRRRPSHQTATSRDPAGTRERLLRPHSLPRPAQRSAQSSSLTATQFMTASQASR